MAGLEELSAAYREADITVVAASADDESGARKMRDDEGLSFPILYGLDVDDMRERFGMYVEKNEKTHLQPAQFILKPEGEIRLASYSSGPVGRLSAEDALEQIESARQ